MERLFQILNLHGSVVMRPFILSHMTGFLNVLNKSSFPPKPELVYLPTLFFSDWASSVTLFKLLPNNLFRSVVSDKIGCDVT